MYYYIFDIKKCKKPSQVEEIKNYLKNLGISGEFTYPTAAQTAEDLVELGFYKQYSTIVIIGGDELANTVATKLLGRKEALGVIPLEASENLCKMIGAENWQEACDSLRFRKISEVRLGQTASGNNFLTHVALDIKAPTDVTLEFRDYLVQAKVKNMVVANYYPGIPKKGAEYLDVFMTSYDPNEDRMLSKLSLLLGGRKATPKERSFSLFRARSLRIFTKSTTPISLNGQTLAKTPQLIESTDESVRLITSRKSYAFEQI